MTTIPRRSKKIVQLHFQFGGIRFIDSPDMGGGARRLAAKLVDQRISMGNEALAVKVVMPVQRLDELFQLVGKQHLAKLFAVNLLNVDEGMLSVEVRQDEIPDRRKAQGAGKV